MRIKSTFVILIITLLIAACGPSGTTTAEPTTDIAAVRTSAASTVVSQFTLTAAAFTVTPAPATNTSAPDVTATITTQPVAQVTNAEGTVVTLCDKYAWEVATVDVNVPDNTVMSPGQDFVKTWKIKNTGACTWGAGYELVFSYGEEMDGEPQPLSAAIAPGQEVDVSVQFTAPDLAGSYFSFWTLQNDKDIPFLGNDNKALYVQILVQ
ncbi:MAG: NBR1-Ig-like domain-containing protein [Chloroflexota bacterium]